MIRGVQETAEQCRIVAASYRSGQATTERRVGLVLWRRPSMPRAIAR